MICLIEALNFKCLRFVSQPLDAFHVLVGPNASGKTTFLDVIGFLGQLVSVGLDAAIAERTSNFQDLMWSRKGDCFELAVEAKIPPDRRKLLAGDKDYSVIRYEVRIGVDPQTQETSIFEERVFLKPGSVKVRPIKSLFPEDLDCPQTIMSLKRNRNWRTVLSKAQGGNDNFYSEVLEESEKGWFPSIRLGPRKSALGNLPEDQTRFPVMTWLKTLLAQGVQALVLNSLLIRRASAPGQARGFKSDGSNLPWVINHLSNHKERFESWISHLRSALPDIKTIRTVERDDDRHRYLMIEFQGGLSVPSWMVSDGTLRLLSLTLPAYLPDFKGVFLIEEPENGIHPSAVESVFQSLSSVYDAQILLASHSPVILSLADSNAVLCFKKTASGATDIVRGSDHPALREWRGETNLGVLFAGGVLG